MRVRRLASIVTNLILSMGLLITQKNTKGVAFLKQSENEVYMLLLFS